MKLLLIKTSSMGDVIHTLPALTDAKNAIPSLQVDWVVEEAFASIPAWHAAVNTIIPIELRKWRKKPFTRATFNAARDSYQQLCKEHYDVILDAQGLIKSALISRLAHGQERIGLDSKSAREPLAALLYKTRILVARELHAITRLRLLFSSALKYPMPSTTPHYGIQLPPKQTPETRPYFVLLHGTTWRSKEWPEIYWRELVTLITTAGFAIRISGGNTHEVERAKRIAANNAHVTVTPFLSIDAMAHTLSGAVGVVAVDTGFAHLAAALDKPLVTLYGATSAALTGTLGKESHHLIASTPSCSPCLKRECHYTKASKVKPACYEALTPERVWACFAESTIPS